ncbi:uncharacterized protein LOC102378992 isoform X2 [Alligator sinensis]|uniref:Uncharacterized protein LOC102378992 isoform X2 n=1 Tax=Alligator sinensis TaxID=38654 RepID=A0A3Q0FRM2_ALLSI|nr:uncharacterized protein LOC102378992 isoform X2 [Alligator sinensis]
MAGFNVHSILVTGANRGIGFELVKQFLERSNPPEKIFATCRNPDGAQELKNLASRHPNLVIVQLEVTDPVSIKAAAARVEGLLKGSGLNLLINNAGIVKTTTLEAETPEYMSQAFLPLLKKAVQESAQKGLSCSKAAIINMSSEAGSIKNVLAWEFGQAVSYRCSKAALNMLTKCQSLAYRELGILCIALHPGWLQTTMGNTSDYQAPMTVDEGVRGIMNTLAKLSEKETGAFINWEGNLLPW